MSSCVFCKIIAGELPAKKIFEDDNLLAFHDVQPAAETHALVIPKIHIESLSSLHREHHVLAANITLAVPKIANILGLSQGFKTVINTGEAGGQKVFHLHYHILGGKHLDYQKL